jgi:hypothetical protein
MRDDVHRGVALVEGPRPGAGDGRGHRRLARLEAPRRGLKKIVKVTVDVSGKMIQDTEEEMKAFAKAQMAWQ